jgi:hypothetical protein
MRPLQAATAAVSRNLDTAASAQRPAAAHAAPSLMACAASPIPQSSPRASPFTVEYLDWREIAKYPEGRF